MDRRELAALTDFVLTVVWPSRTFTVVNHPAGQSVFPVRGTWNTTHDLPLVWVNGNRLVGTATLTAASQVTISPAAPNGAHVIVLVHPGSGSGYLPRNPAGASMLGALSMGNQRITDLAASVNPNDAVRRSDVEAIVNTLIGANYVLRAGSAMTGPLVLPAPVAWTDEGGDTNGTPLGAAARRNEVVRKAHTGTQTVVGKLATAATVDDDPATTLTTKGWVLARVGAVAPRLRVVTDGAATNSSALDTTTSGAVYTVYVYHCGDGLVSELADINAPGDPVTETISSEAIAASNLTNSLTLTGEFISRYNNLQPDPLYLYTPTLVLTPTKITGNPSTGNVCVSGVVKRYGSGGSTNMALLSAIPGDGTWRNVADAYTYGGSDGSNVLLECKADAPTTYTIGPAGYVLTRWAVQFRGTMTNGPGRFRASYLANAAMPRILTVY